MTVLKISLFNLLPFSFYTVHYPAAERLFTVDKQLSIELSISYISGHLFALPQAVNATESAYRGVINRNYVSQQHLLITHSNMSNNLEFQVFLDSWQTLVQFSIYFRLQSPPNLQKYLTCQPQKNTNLSTNSVYLTFYWVKSVKWVYQHLCTEWKWGWWESRVNQNSKTKTNQTIWNYEDYKARAAESGDNSLWFIRVCFCFFVFISQNHKPLSKLHSHNLSLSWQNQTITSNQLHQNQTTFSGQTRKWYKWQHCWGFITHTLHQKENSQLVNLQN